jgi:anti-sigma-K factor RskA
MSEHPYDNLPVLLFGELNRAELSVVSNHLATCDDCRRELAVLAAASASLRATARQGQTSVAPAPAVAPADRAPGAARPARRRGQLIGFAAALALVTAAVLWTGGLLRADRSASTIPLAGVGAVAASGQASMATDDSQREMTVTADDLPALRPGQYYEVWLLDPDAGTVFPVGILPPDGQASFTLPASVVGRYQVIDVSLEADDGNPAHSKRSLVRGRYA